ncbi:MAG: phage tail tape measure protein [Prolixibacteraceae bacterium]|nr:phage tail tape measure protein [Prolixibacteraceae bacterium]
MGKKLRDEDLNLNIIVNGDKGKKELGDLEKSTRDLTVRNKELREEKQKLIRAGQQESEAFKRITKEITENNATLKTNETRMAALRKEIGITGLTMAQLRSEQTRLKRLMDSSTPETEQWKLFKNQLAAVDGQMAKLKGGGQKMQLSIGKMADGFNRYFGMISVWVASFTGVVLGFKKASQAYAEFDDKVADVQKTTGLTKEEVLDLDKSLQELDTRTAQQGLLDLAKVAGKLGISAQEDVEGFVRAADKIAVALTEDLGGNIEESVNDMGKLVDIFKLKDEFGMEQSLIKVGSAINSLGAAGTANEGYIVEFTKRMAGVAPAADISIDKVMGLGATLDQFGQTSEISSTTISAVWTDMFKAPGEYAKIAGMSLKDFNDLLNTDSNEAFIKFLTGLKGNNGGLSEMATKLDGLGLEGKRSISVLGVLANNTETLRTQQKLSADEFEKGTSLINEFNIKNETMQARLEKSRKDLDLMTRELGSNLSPAMLVSTNGVTYFIKGLSAGIKIFKEYYPLIVSSAIAVTAYTIALRVSTAEKKASFLATKLGAAMEATYGTIKGIVTGKINLATVAQRAWNVAVAQNPIGAILAVVVAVGAAIWQYSKTVNAATAAQKALNELETRALQNTVEQKQEMEKWLDIARDKNRSIDERTAAVAALNKLSPEFLGNLTLEKINTEAADEATKNYIKSIEQKARVQAAQEMLTELEKERIKAVREGSDVELSTMQQVWNSVSSLGNIHALTAKNIVSGIKNQTKAEKEYLEQKKALSKIIGDGSKTDPGTPIGTRKTIGDQVLEWDGTNWKLVQELGNGGGSGGGELSEAEKKARAKAYQDIEILQRKEVNAIKQKLLDKQISEEEANAQILQKETEFLTKKIALQKKYGEDYTDTESAILDKSLKAAEELDKKSADARKKEQEKALKALESREDAELNVIKKQLADRLIDEDTAEQLLLQKEIDFLNERIALKKQYGEDTAELEGQILDKVNKIADNAAKGNADREKALADLRKDYADEDVVREQEKAAALAELDRVTKNGSLISEEEYQKLKTGITEKYEDERFKKIRAYLDATQQILGGLSDFFSARKDAELAKAGDNAKKKEQIEKKYAKKQQAIAIGQAVISGAQAVLELWAAKSTIPEPANSIYKGVMSALIVATTGAQIAKIKGQSFYTGGYTGGNRKYKPTGIVHEGEFVNNQEGVNNPDVRQFLDVFDYYQRTGQISKLNTKTILASIPTKQMYTGGFASGNNKQTASANIVASIGSGNGIDKNTSVQLIDAINQLMSWQPYVAVETYEPKRDRFKEMTDGGLK